MLPPSDSARHLSETSLHCLAWVWGLQLSKHLWAEVATWFFLLVASVKVIAQIIHVVYVTRNGGDLNRRLTNGCLPTYRVQKEAAASFLRSSRPIDTFYEERLPKILSKSINVLFHQAILVLLGTTTVLIFSWNSYAQWGKNDELLPLALILTAGALFQMTVAVIRNLIFGPRDSLFDDIALPSFIPTTWT